MTRENLDETDLDRPVRRAPRYRTIAEELRAAIGGGDYPVGSRLPTEEQLCERYSASRQTLREALRRLTDEGLIVRRPRSGSVVVAAHAPTVFSQSFVSVESLLNYPHGTIRKLIGTQHVEVDHALAAALRCAPGSTLFLIQALRQASGSELPLCWTDIYLPPRFAGVIGHPRHETITVADQIAEMYGEVAVRTEVEITAGEVPATMSRRLRVRSGTPALFVTRRYADERGEPLETTISVHPGPRYSCRFEFRREPSRRRPDTAGPAS